MSTLNFYEKLVDIQSKLVAGKDKKNDFGGFSYRTAEGILAAVKPHLAAHGLFMAINDEIVQIGANNITKTEERSEVPNKEGVYTNKVKITEEVDARFYLRSTVTVTDGITSHSVSAYAREALSKKGMDDAQVTGSASSYARKYALNGMWGIDDSKQDPDSKHGEQALMAEVDAALNADTKEAAQAALGKLKAKLAKLPAVQKYAVEQFKTKFA